MNYDVLVNQIMRRILFDRSVELFNSMALLGAANFVIIEKNPNAKHNDWSNFDISNNISILKGLQ